VRDAAYQARARQLEVRAAAERTATAIRRAKSAGEPTAVIWSEGDRELWPPYRRVEMSVSSGNAVAVTTVMDPDTMMPRYALEALALDPENGEALPDEEPLSPRREFTDPDEWRAAAEALRATLL
jgi:hypothetical protein